jgi:hypothetical protein
VLSHDEKLFDQITTPKEMQAEFSGTVVTVMGARRGVSVELLLRDATDRDFVIRYPNEKFKASGEILRRIDQVLNPHRKSVAIRRPLQAKSRSLVRGGHEPRFQPKAGAAVA